MVHHLEQTSRQADGSQAEHADHDHAYVADTAVGDEPFDIVLTIGAQGPVHDAGRGKPGDERQSERQAGIGGQRNAQSQEAIGSNL